MRIFDENDIETKELVYGFIKEFGITASSEEQAKIMLLDHIQSKGEIAPTEIKIKYKHIGQISPEEMQREIFDDQDINDSLLQSPYNEGVWYATGCGFYNDKNN